MITFTLQQHHPVVTRGMLPDSVGNSTPLRSNFLKKQVLEKCVLVTCHWKPHWFSAKLTRAAMAKYQFEQVHLIINLGFQLLLLGGCLANIINFHSLTKATQLKFYDSYMYIYVVSDL